MTADCSKNCLDSEVQNKQINGLAGAARVELDQHVRLEEPHKPIAILADGPNDSFLQQLKEILYSIVEIPLAATILLITAPILLIIILIIRHDSPGPAFFVHYRTGRCRRVLGRDIDYNKIREPKDGIDPDRYYWVPATFPFVKLRTMSADAGERFPNYYWWNYDLTHEEVQSMYYKSEGDPRLTKVGSWVRATSLDELPNFWNVLTGDAHLVGPRPEAPEVQGFYTEEQMKKFTVKPGLTCLSKIYGRGGLSVGEQIRWDLEYVRSSSIQLDIRIVLRTVRLVLTKHGAF